MPRLLTPGGCHHQPSRCRACAAASKRWHTASKSASPKSRLKVRLPVPTQLRASPCWRRWNCSIQFWRDGSVSFTVRTLDRLAARIGFMNQMAPLAEQLGADIEQVR